MRLTPFLTAVFGLLALAVPLSACSQGYEATPLSPAEVDAAASLSLSTLGAPPPDPSNAVADNQNAANLGHALFFDTRLSANDQVSCASCHQPERGFTDGLAHARGIGQLDRKTMSVVGSAHSTWQFWDGRKDSLWSQALGPLEASDEHGLTRSEVAEVVARAYPGDYEAVFGALPNLGDRSRFPARVSPQGDEAARSAWAEMKPADRGAVTEIFVNVGKALAAYERGLEPTPTRFDTYADAVQNGATQGAIQNSAIQNGAAAGESALSPDEVAGLRLFVGKAGCDTCHSGPLLTDESFHNTGVPAASELAPDLGRLRGAALVRSDEFNCLSRYSDAEPARCTALKELKTDTFGLERAYKVPSLRDVAAHAPYMHAGQFGTLREVLEHYNRAPDAPSGYSELHPLGLSETELIQLEAFLKTLSSDPAPR